MAKMYGTRRHDVFMTKGHDDVVRASGGDDVIREGLHRSSNDRFYGQDGDDFIFSSTGSDILNGGHGNDQMEVLPHYNATVIGGAGHDVLYLDGSADDYSIVSTGGHTFYRYHWQSHDAHDRAIDVTGVEVVHFTGDGFPG